MARHPGLAPTPPTPELSEEDVNMSAGTPVEQTRTKGPLWKSLGFQVVLSLVLGIVVGIIWPGFAASLNFLGTIFLNLIKTAVAPLVFLTVTLGILAAGDVKRIGKVGLTAIIYFEIVSTIALGLGLLFGNLSRVGEGTGQLSTNASAAQGAAKATSQAAQSHTTFIDFVTKLFPDNFLGAFTGGNLLQVLVIALIFGFGLLTLAPAKREPVETGLNTISTAFFRFISVIMRLAPIGTFGATAYAVGSNGTAVLVSLAYFVVCVWVGIILFIGIVLGAVCAIFRINLFGLLRFLKDEILITLGTASSESVLPRLLEKMPRYGVSKQVAGLVLPTGYAFNLDGTSIFMSVGVLFLANAYGVPLSLGQQLSILAVMFLTSKGAATVSGGSFVVFAATVTTTGVLPVAGLALIFGVYRFISIAVATSNVIGNAVATVVVAKITKEYTPAGEPAGRPEVAA
ncbi:cation:dicarboxylase symporter family transporter [Amycolatopsis carbonis]|uniref:Cation:dicarboxylase symporter family transporter n=1 Tax=Amycolatopsis carbonis TaxID=715471 RepID=A0A9Y2IR97_9PSEU|nr:cation:dicarboxylase symporter family transporter [Amycolatopsis sp. 2-15]WIX83328.1 cation:dicarboxylase symporter family transporter [Amycolatopsis sp. 2-15]